MPDFAELIARGSAHAWLFVPSAILLGALHGLEPGHSKTMMAAFIVAVRGTVRQAVLLGLAATISHTAIVWIIALGGLYLWQGIGAEELEPWLQLVSGVIIIGMALWMILRTRRDRIATGAAAGHHQGGHHHHHDHSHHHHHQAHGHHHDHGPGHAHGDIRRIDTGHGTISVEIFEAGVPPRFRIRNEGGAHWHAEDVTVTTKRPDGTRQAFAMIDRGGYMESLDAIPEPHAFMARISLGHGGHTHDYDLAFAEGEGHHHHQPHGLDVGVDGHADAHERAHANDIRRRFTDREVTTWQIVVFGLTGGLIPCPAAITVLLLCIQVGEVSLGVVMVLCFSIGLAITLVAVGAASAWSVRHVGQRSGRLSALAARAPYWSGALLVLVGLYVGGHGVAGLLAAA